jgi:hypothetical protein
MQPPYGLLVTHACWHKEFQDFAADQATILARQATVEEFLTNEVRAASVNASASTHPAQSQPLFFESEAILSRFLDLDQLITLCIQACFSVAIITLPLTQALLSQIPKQETVRVAENNIQNIIYLKHSLTLVEPMRQLLRAATSPLMVAFAELLADARFAVILDRIASVVTDDTHFEVCLMSFVRHLYFAPNQHSNSEEPLTHACKNALLSSPKSMVLIHEGEADILPHQTLNAGILDVARRTYSETVADITGSTSVISIIKVM